MKCSFSASNSQEHFAVLPIIHGGVIKWQLVVYQCVMQGKFTWWQRIRQISDLIIELQAHVKCYTCGFGDVGKDAVLWTEGPSSVPGE